MHHCANTPAGALVEPLPVDKSPYDADYDRCTSL